MLVRALSKGQKTKGEMSSWLRWHISQHYTYIMFILWTTTYTQAIDKLTHKHSKTFDLLDIDVYIAVHVRPVLNIRSVSNVQPVFNVRQFLIFSQFLMFGQFLMFNQFLMFGQFLMFSQFLLFGQFLMFCQYQTGMGRITLQCSALHYNYFHKTSIILQLQLHVFWKVMHYITITLPK